MNKKPVYEISRTGVVPALDGWLQSPCWLSAKWVNRFLAMDTWETGKPVASALLYDDDFLYAGIKVDEPRMGLLRTGELPVCDDDIIELYFDINDSKQGHLVFSINATGNVAADKWVVDNPGWGNRYPITAEGIKCVSKLTGNGWQIEMAIPFSALNTSAPFNGDVWNVNVCRIDRLGYQWSFWAPSEPVEHNYEIIPPVTFTGINENTSTGKAEISWPSESRFAMRGFMYDTSRGSIIYTPDYWIERFHWMKDLGFNTFLLYFENHLQYEKHHSFVPDGSWTMDDLIRVQKAGFEYGIDVIPAQTSIGHCTGILAHPDYAEMAEEGSDGYQFCTSHPESLRVLTEIFDELAAKSQSPYISINADESAYLGLCSRCQEKFPGWTKGKIFQHHIMEIYNVIKSHGKRMMMWDDMLWLYPEAVEGLPRDIVLLDWHYSQHRRYPSIDHWRSLGFDVVVCPGMYSVDNAFWIADHGAESGAMGIINTLWEDHSLPIGSRWQHFMATSWAAGQKAPANRYDWFSLAGEKLFGKSGDRLGYSLAAQENISKNGYRIAQATASSLEWQAACQTRDEAMNLLSKISGTGIVRELLEEFVYSRRLMVLHSQVSMLKGSVISADVREKIEHEMAALKIEGLARWEKQCCVPSQMPAFMEIYTIIENNLAE